MSLYARPLAGFIGLSLALFISTVSFAQYKMVWEKPIQVNGLVQSADEITGLSELDGGHLVMFRVWDLDIPLPAFAFIDKNDKLWPAQFINIDSLSEVVMVGAVRISDKKVKVMCNDYTDRDDGKAIPLPFEIILDRKETDTVFMLGSAKLTNVTNLNGDRSFGVTDNTGDGKYGQYMSMVKYNAQDIPRTYIYSILPDQPIRNIQFEDSYYAKVWFANEKVEVISVETPMDNGRFFYQIHVLDHDLKFIQSYPAKDKAAVRNNIPAGVKDRLVRLTYKPVQDIGFVSCQITNQLKENMLSWYIFNGLSYTNPVFTQVGIDGNLQATIGPVLPDNEVVIMDGDLKNGAIQVNSMIVAVDDNGRGANHDLVLSVGDYYGLETSRKVIRGYVDSSLNRVNAWTNDDNQVYVVANTQNSLTTQESGLFISKWQATEDAISNTLHKVKDARGWLAEPFYSKLPLDTKDKTSYIILDVDKDDPNYVNRQELIGKKFEIQEGGLRPYRSSYWFAGTVKIGRKKYDLTRFTIAKAQ